MDNTICSRVATVGFWDGYARWYKLWMEHTRYHDGVIDVLTTTAEPGWKVLDIGAGNGILSLPLCAIGCDVTALEPSVGMRNLLYEQAFSRGIDWISVDERTWEDVPAYGSVHDLDLVIACNSLHLTVLGFTAALEKLVLLRPKQVFLATELKDRFAVPTALEGYRLAFAKIRETDSAFSYHTVDEALEHAEFKKNRLLSFWEQADVTSRLVRRDDHFLIEDAAIVGMFWWERIDA
jgi:hypothetical protein